MLAAREMIVGFGISRPVLGGFRGLRHQVHENIGLDHAIMHIEFIGVLLQRAGKPGETILLQSHPDLGQA